MCILSIGRKEYVVVIKEDDRVVFIEWMRVYLFEEEEGHGKKWSFTEELVNVICNMDMGTVNQITCFL